MPYTSRLETNQLTRRAKKQIIAVRVGTRKVMTVASEMFRNESESGHMSESTPRQERKGED